MSCLLVLFPRGKFKLPMLRSHTGLRMSFVFGLCLTNALHMQAAGAEL